jgi:RimJ/RimL family protein N-acetyltransferase
MNGNEHVLNLPVLETDRLFLLPWKLEYAKDMLIFASNEKVINAAGGWKLVPDINKAKAKIKSYIKRDSLNWAISIKTYDSFKIIGSIGMRVTKALKEYDLCMDFGYLLAEEYWGQGICTEASQKLMNYTFMNLKCDAMMVSHRIFNVRSQRVIEKCKFKLRGIYPKSRQGDPNSLAYYILSREAYIDLFNITELPNSDCPDAIQMRKKHENKKIKESKPSKQPQNIKGSPYSLDNQLGK